MPTSRFVRPAEPHPILLQDRDRKLLRSVSTHRLLTADHLHALHFADCSLRTAQLRLRKLWEQRYLDRLYPGSLAGHRQAQRPLYAPGPGSASVVGGSSAGSARWRDLLQLEHDLVATDFLVGLVSLLDPVPCTWL